MSNGTDLGPLVLRAQQRDAEAFAGLYSARADAVGRYVITILGNALDAEDVVAEAFLRAWRKLPSLKEPQRFDAWLFRIAHNAAMDTFKQRKGLALEAVPEPADASRLSAPAALAEHRWNVSLLHQAMHALSDEQRQVIVLRFLLDLPHADVAAQMGKSEQAVRALQYRALGQLRRLLKRADAA